ncbi:MAG TPA: biliverdin-producing heme oxygenase [Rhizomicrobium sp.]|nr:biliverdin-producing heme oxygenase [Rhizomicrobium sp.]
MTIKNGCDSIREKLREATANLHAEFDEIGEAMLARGFEGYARFLAGQAAVIIPLEKRLEISGIGNVLPDWDLRARRFDLKADLRQITQRCEFLDVPGYRAPAQLLGAAYALEGSRLDASLLLHTLRLSTATRFLRHGQGKGLWPRFLSVLEANDEVRQDFEQAKAAAMEVFRLFIRAIISAARIPAVAAAE